MRCESALVAALAASAVAAQRTVTVRNLCSVSVWPAVLTRLGTAPNGATGWEAAPRTSLSFTAEPGWMGRIWARTRCNFEGQASASQCETGGCDSGLLCSSVVSGAPASFVELTLASGTGSLGSLDFYDVSLVDGFNLPITISPITSDGKCSPAACVADVLADCPSQLTIEKDGEIIACSSACRAGIGGNTANSTDCCTGSFNTPDTCAASQVQFYDYFHQKCPNVYAYAYDDAAGLRQCAASDSGPNYEVTFCRETDVISTPTSTATVPPLSTSSGSQSSPSSQDLSASHPLTTTSDSNNSDKSTSLPPPTPANRASLAPTIAGATVGGVVLVALAAGFLFYFFRRVRRKQDLLAHPQMFQPHPLPSSSQHHMALATLATAPISSSQHYTSAGAAVSPISSRAALRSDHSTRSPGRWSFSRRSSSVLSPPPAYSAIGSYR